MACRSSEIVVTVYPNGGPREGLDGVEFHSPDQVVFMMWLIENARGSEEDDTEEHAPTRANTHHYDGLQISCCDARQVMLLQGFLAQQRRAFQAMFASHRRILSDQMMQLYIQLLETRTTTPRLGASHSEPVGDPQMLADPVDDVPLEQIREECEFGEEDPGDTDGGSSGSSEDEFVSETPIGTWFLLPAPLPVLDISSMDSHFHTLNLDATEEEWLTYIGDGDDKYDLDSGIELRSANRCPWTIRVFYRVNLGYWEVRKFITSPHTSHASRMSIDHHAQLDNNVIAGYIMHIIKKNSAVRIEVLRGQFRRATISVHRTERQSPFRKGSLRRTRSSLTRFSGHSHRASRLISIASHLSLLIGRTCMANIYGAKLLMAIAQDGNSNSFPLGFAIVKSEST
ncbi:hypothetical protein PIB30_077830 [Stylosanthes scabra]|uniref:Uncharacterized protein n=1 Tax=Stylosanthes scabra TaxID=79078 RepID=A0ABU6ZPC2_9FABA|nr:hypothetical protein [Stylosanthes scabra]